MFRGRRGKKGPTMFCTANSLTIFVPHFQYLPLAFLGNGEQAEQILQHAQQWSERSVWPVDLLHSSNNYLNLRLLYNVSMLRLEQQRSMSGFCGRYTCTKARHKPLHPLQLCQARFLCGYSYYFRDK